MRANTRVAPTANSVPHSGDPNLHILRIAYETPIRLVGMRTDVDLVAPLLATMETASSPSIPIPTADMGWQVWVPAELRVIESKGDLQLLGTDSQSGFPYDIFDMLNTTLVKRTVAHTISVNSEIVGRRSAAKAGTGPAQPAAAAQSSSRSAGEPLMNDLFAVAVPQTEALFEQSAQRDFDEKLSLKDFGEFSNQKPNEGLRTLPIVFEGPRTWHSISMTGFGDSPNIRLSVVNNARLGWITNSLAALIIAIGLAVLNRRIWQVMRWTLAMMAFSIGIALISPRPIETGILASGYFYASIGVLFIRLLFGVILGVRAISPLNPRSAVTRLLFCFALSVAATGRNAAAQEATVGKDIGSLNELISILKSHSGTSSGTIEIPSDAIVIPYQTDSPPLTAGAEKILVPYSIYTQLMNLAHPDKADKKILEPPVEYSLSSLSYEL
ncbi:MAG TPA: hypothetical protein VM260_01705, partial [Pirellula sp.]|nr:hypothetical protein [Pirellula sp.]